MPESYKYIAKTLSGLEQVLARELDIIGAAQTTTLNRAVAFTGSRALLYESNLRSRLATRILLPISRFNARNRKELYRGVADINWRDWLDIDSTLAVDVVLASKNFDNSMFVAQCTKDAIVDQLRTKSGERPSVDTEDPDLNINVHLVGDTASVAIDSSGSPLQRRGYRTDGGAAPLSEVLAAGILALTEWDPSTPLVDPMCGSGTFLIEGAMVARNIAPGLRRKSWGFMGWKDFDRDLYRAAVDSAKKEILTSAPAQILGGDIDAGQIRDAQANAARAGVAENIGFRCTPLARFEPPDPPGTAITNPPYGERIPIDDIKSLYRSLGDLFKKRFAGYTAFVFTANLSAAKSLGLRASRRIELYNGPLEARLLRYELYSGSRKNN